MHQDHKRAGALGRLPESSAGRIGLVVVAGLVSMFFALQVIQLLMMGKWWSALVMLPVALVAIGIIGSIAGLSQSILPQTQTGRMGMWLFAGFIVTAGLLGPLVAITGGSPWLAVFVIPLGISSLGGGIASVVALTRDHDRGMLVILPLMVGLLAVFFVAGEFALPH